MSTLKDLADLVDVLHLFVGLDRPVQTVKERRTCIAPDICQELTHTALVCAESTPTYSFRNRITLTRSTSSRITTDQTQPHRQGGKAAHLSQRALHSAVA